MSVHGKEWHCLEIMTQCLEMSVHGKEWHCLEIMTQCLEMSVHGEGWHCLQIMAQCLEMSVHILRNVIMTSGDTFFGDVSSLQWVTHCDSSGTMNVWFGGKTCAFCGTSIQFWTLQQGAEFWQPLCCISVYLHDIKAWQCVSSGSWCHLVW
jgi:hypothetical protein